MHVPFTDEFDVSEAVGSVDAVRILSALFEGMSSATCIVHVQEIFVRQEISLFADSLQHLSLCLEEKRWDTVDFAPLTTLSNLGRLEYSHVCRSFRGFVAVLPQLCSLSKVVLLGTNPVPAESIARCSALKAVVLSTEPHKHVSLSEILKLTQLTELTARFRWDCLEDLCSMTRLECLRLHVDPKDDGSLDQALSCMPNLQNLEVTFRDLLLTNCKNIIGRPRLSGEVFSHMDRLKSVSLCRVDISKSFFQELASRTGLTKLEFSSYEPRRYPRSFLCQINLLRNLKELALYLSPKDTMCNLLSPEKLPKLRRLNISGNRLHVSAVRREFERKMHPALINTEKSSWRSRCNA